MQDGIENLPGQYYCAISVNIAQSPKSARCIAGLRISLVNIIVQLPVSKNIAQLPGLGLECLLLNFIHSKSKDQIQILDTL